MIKRFTQKALAVFVCIASIISLCCCFAVNKEKKFEKAGLTITLTSQFTEKENVQFTANYVSNKIIVTTVKETFDSFKKLGYKPETMTTKTYAELMQTTYKSFYNSASDISEENGVSSFIYENDALGKDYTYIWYGFKGPDAFWGVTFGCEKNNFEKLENEMRGYAKTVEISSGESTDNK